MVEILLAAAVVGVIALICGVGLSFASKFLAVPTDEKFEAVRAALPGANCGACGFSGCDGYAEAIAKGEAECNKCPVGGEKTAAELSEILGVEVTVTKQVAFVACGKKVVQLAFLKCGLGIYTRSAYKRSEHQRQAFFQSVDRHSVLFLWLL